MPIGALLSLKTIRAELEKAKRQRATLTQCVAYPWGNSRRCQHAVQRNLEAWDMICRAFRADDTVLLMTAFICDHHYNTKDKEEHYIQLFRDAANESTGVKSPSTHDRLPIDPLATRCLVEPIDPATPPCTPCHKPRTRAALSAPTSSPNIKTENNAPGIHRRDQKAIDRNPYELSHGYLTPRTTPPPKSASSSAEKPKITNQHGESFEDLISRCLSAAATPAKGTPTKFTITFDIDISPTGDSYTSKGERPLDPSRIDYAIRRELLTATEKKEGTVYILSTPDRIGCVKIGRSTDVKKRLRALRRDCHMRDLQVERGHEPFKSHYYVKVERLVHAELRNFREDFKCDHTDGTRRTHKEWFTVSPEVAAQTIKKWYNFLAAEPYGENGQLKAEWKRKLNKRHTPCDPSHLTDMEAWDDHHARNERWEEWIRSM